MRRNGSYTDFLTFAALLIVATFAGRIVLGAPHILSNGPGDGSVTIGVDGFGSFGSSIGPDASNAEYDPVGDIGSSGTSFESAVFLSGGPPTWLTSGGLEGPGGLPNPAITGDATHATSSFVHGSLSFLLEQRLIESFDNDGNRLGTVLEQQYHMQNLVDVPNNFMLTRYLDGDLLFDGTISDGGGRLLQAGNEILFETDAASGSEASTTFVGITASAVGNQSLDPSQYGRFEIAPYSGLRNRVTNNINLSNTVIGDTTGDGFIDSAYDVTLAMRIHFEIPGFGDATFTTHTLFGNAVPPRPGSSEAVPILPDDDEPPFVFDIDPPGPGQTTWFDPDIAVGYEYEVTTGANFESVTVPSTAVVPQIGDYNLELFNGSSFEFASALSPGELFTFAPGGTNRFRVTGINAGLGLDPDDPLAFPIGFSFVSTETTQFSMTPLVVPEPGTLILLACAAFGLIALPRR
jgi:hypothetical protein